MSTFGLIGCGNISDIYLKNSPRFAALDIVACADLDRARAEAKAAQYGIRALPVDELLAAPGIEIVLNLTVPGAHAEVDLAVLAAGKHVYAEKPLALNRDDGRRILELAAARDLRVGSAPDTFLGAGLQTCRRLIDAGTIGEPVAATAFMISRGHEHWHPNPAFYYQPGGGPLFDMGPYYLTALVSMLGPVARVTGATRVTFPERRVTSQPNYGQVIPVEVPTHVTGVLEFASGAQGLIVTTFDVWSSTLPWLEIYGAEGTLRLPDPNTFGGPVYVKVGRAAEWSGVPITLPYADNARGLGAADLASAVAQHRPPRAGGDLAFHVLDIMEAVHKAATQGRHILLTSTCARPAPLSEEPQPGELD
jgi:predicted dehydrogenase